MCDIGQHNTAASGLSRHWIAEDELSPIQWKRILDRLKITDVHIQGVEPLLYPKFDELLTTIASGRVLKLTTNGWLLKEHVPSISRYVHDTAVSIDGLEDVHDYIRGVPGSFRRAYESLLELKGLGNMVRVSYAITPDNTQDMIPLYDTLTALGIPIVFNHYNYIHPRSCHGFDCSPSNLSIYNPADVDREALLNAITHCEKASSVPDLRTREELEQYYCIPPEHYKLPGTGCKSLNEMTKGKRYVIGADGRFMPPARCWLNGPMGNALDPKTLPKDTQWLVRSAKEIKKRGLPPPCQRLCCAGKVL